MGKLRNTLLGILLTCSFCVKAGISLVQVNTDKETIEAVMANIAAEQLFLQSQNKIVDSIRVKQNKLAELLGEMATYKMAVLKTYQSIQDFKQESAFYTRIVRVGIDIVNHSAEAFNEIRNSKLAGKINASRKVTSLIADAVSLGQTFADVVANGKVEHPMKKEASAKSLSGDGHNLLNRHERLKLANDILYRMRQIDHDLTIIAWRARMSTIKDVIIAVDRKGFANAWNAKWEINSILRKWDKLSK